jgi:GH24 family phage-related lysozyme (muramidase)
VTIGSHPLNYEPYPEVQPQAGGLAHQDIHADPDMFGAAIGRGLQTLGQGIEHADNEGFDVATEQERQHAQIHGAELHTYFSDKATDLTEKYTELKGAAALNALPQYKKDLNNLYGQVDEQAGSPYVKGLLAQNTRKEMDWFYQSGAKHAAAEQKTWAAETAKNATTSYGAKAGLAAGQNDYDAMDHFLFQADQEMRNYLEPQGYDPTTIEQRVKQTRSQALSNIIQTKAGIGTDGGAGDPDGALVLFKKYAPQMDDETRLATVNKLRPIFTRQAGAHYADEAAGLRPPPGEAPQQDVGGVPAPFLSAIKSSEGFSATAKPDYKQLSSGYGTRAKFEGETIDRAEADRRFNTAIEEATKIVDSVNPNLDAGTRAALVSLSYNAGPAWATSGLGDRIRAGDLAGAKEKFLEYSRAGGVENEGLAARRYREASWFGKSAPPANSMLPDKGEAISRLQTLTRAEPAAVQDAALAHLNKTYTEAISTQALEKYTVQNLVKNDLESTLKTGQGVNDFDLDRVASALGPSEANKWRADKAEAFATWNATHDMFQLGDQQIDQRLTSLQPTPGAPDFAHQQAVFQKVQERATELRKQRNEDPASTVAQDPHVRAAQAAVDQRKPETFLPLAASRMAAQEAAGIPEANRSPITQEEALRLTQPLRTMLPGQEREVLSQIATNMQKMFGPDADTAFSYALRVHKVDAEVAQVAARMMKKLNLGQVPTQDDAQAADTATEIAKADAAVNAGNNGNNAAYSVPGYGMGPSQQEVDAGAAARQVGVNLPARAIIDLRLNPKLAADFDKKYGAGTSAKILQNYPVR